MSARSTTITARVLRTERMRSSKYGNPRFRVTLDPGEGLELVTLPTSPDAGVAYGIENREYRDRPHAFHVNGRGHIYGVTDAPESEDGQDEPQNRANKGRSMNDKPGLRVTYRAEIGSGRYFDVTFPRYSTALHDAAVEAIRGLCGASDVTARPLDDSRPSAAKAFKIVEVSA